MIVDPIADTFSKDAAQARLDQHFIPGNYGEAEEDEFYAIAKIIQGVAAFENDLQSRVGDRLAEVEELGPASVPATCDTLHTLYVAYDIGTTVTRLSTHLLQTKSDVKLGDSLVTAEKLIKATIAKATVIKQSLDEGGWIDRVLKGVYQGDIDVSADSLSIPGTLKSVVDENFMEEWAGQVVESWKDSVKGFAYFKA